MKKEIREVRNDVVQITLTDERWYVKTGENSKTKNPEMKFVPSMTWIAEFYPKGIGFYKWLADKGWDESQALKEAAGERGSKVHQAIEALHDGEEVAMDSKFTNPKTDQEEEITVEEYEAVVSYVDWHSTVEMKTFAKEITFFNEKHGYAGTVDWVGLINDELYIVDYKTSQGVWPSHHIQLSGYKEGLRQDKELQKIFTEKKIKIEDAKLAILQIGYRKNRHKYKFNEIDDDFDLVLATKRIWEKENRDVKPKQIEYPIKVSLNIKKKGE